MKVIWLASYPKSGNTFFRMLLHTYFFGESHDSNEIGRRIPDLHKVMTQGKTLQPHSDQKLLFAKTHFCLSGSHPHATDTAGFIYILRNPRDVLLSNARYFGLSNNPEDLRHFATVFIENLGVPMWRKMKMGSWTEHFSSWLFATNQTPHLFLDYGDLRVNTADALKRAIKFLGEEPDESRIQIAVRHCALDEVRKFEIKEKSLGKKDVFVDLPNSASFVGEGKVAQSLAFIGEDIEMLYQERFGRFVHMFGY